MSHQPAAVLIAWTSWCDTFPPRTDADPGEDRIHTDRRVLRVNNVLATCRSSSRLSIAKPDSRWCMKRAAASGKVWRFFQGALRLQRKRKKSPHPLRDGVKKEGLQSRELNTDWRRQVLSSGAQFKNELVVRLRCALNRRACCARDYELRLSS